MEVEGEKVGDRDEHLVNSIQSMLQTVPPLPSEPCIYRVPYVLRHVNEEAYTPVIVSIGPFHHGKENLQDMEVHKQRYLIDFLKRRPDIELMNYVRRLRVLEERARNCYAERILLESDDFIKIMLLDGCFIIELFLKSIYTLFRDKNDPIFMASVIRFEVRRDMLLLENQLPFFVLECLFDLNVEAGLHMGLSFDKIALHFIGSFVGSLQLRRSSYQVKHFVDLYVQCHALPEARMFPRGVTAIRSIPSATKLHDSGVEFKKSMTSTYFMDVKFSTQGFFEMPSFVVGDTAESFLRNLIAFEQCDNSNSRYISEYIGLMDCLIDTPSDVALLRKCGIIDNLLGNDEELSQLFNKLGSGVIYNPQFYFYRLYEDVTAYYTTPWHAWRAKLRRDYFNTPWAILSVFAAVALLFLAFIQSVCSVISLKE